MNRWRLLLGLQHKERNLLFSSGHVMLNLLYTGTNKNNIPNHFSVIYLSRRLSFGDLFNYEDYMFSFKCGDILFLYESSPGISLLVTDHLTFEGEGVGTG